MKKWLLLLLLCSAFGTFAQTVSVQGDQTGVWNADTVRVIGDVHVVDSLRIMPGTVVLFDDFYGITVNAGASLYAQGVEGDSIYFTVADTTGIGIHNSAKGSWNGITCVKSGPVRFDYCVLQYAKASDTLDMSGGALSASLADDIEFNHSVLRFNYAREHGGAVNATHSVFRMSDCVVNNNKVFSDDNLFYRYGGALRFLNCDVVMRGMDFHENDGSPCVGGVLSLDSCSLILDRAVFHHNLGLNGGGMYLMRSNDKSCILSNLLFYNNVSGHFAGALAFCDASPDVYNITVTGNSSIGVSCNGIFFYQESSPRLANCIIYANYPLDSVNVIDSTQMWMWTFEGFGPEFRNCLVEDGTNQIHSAENIQLFEDIMDADPLFVDPANHDYRLSKDSPCRDAGWVSTPEEILAGVDLDGLPRMANYRIDLGPYEYSAAMVPEVEPLSDAVHIEGNPLNAQSRLTLRLDSASDVTLRVYSLQGVQLASREFGKCPCGTNRLDLGGLAEDLRPGVYLMAVSADNKTWTLKVIK